MEMKKIATRESYGKCLVDIAGEFPNMVVLDADLTGATKTNLFKKAHPQRHINCGIAESNMMGVAAGLAAEGLIPVVSSFAMFAAGRAYEQVRNSVGYPHLNVKIAATHGGISVGEDGASHQCCEDIALMRTIPGMVVVNPSDDVEARAALRAALEHDGPVYLRFGRMAVPVYNKEEDYRFELGKGVLLREGRDVTLIATGLCVWEALRAADRLAGEGIDAEVINIHTIKPIDSALIAQSVKKTGRAAAIEEHSIIGGLGDAVADVLCRECPAPLKKIGVPDVYGQSGSAAELVRHYGLGEAEIAAAVVNWMK
ncbi:MAG: transketolase family protein [Clostridia bacterium]|nr:transketolase family protein [Clostridia bacterium]